MTHSRYLSTFLFLAGALTTGSVYAEPQPAATDPVTQQYNKLAEISNQLADVQKAMAALDTIRQELKDLRITTNVAVQKAQADINDLQRTVKKVQDDLEAMKSAPKALSSSSKYQPDTGFATVTGRIVLKNTFGQRVSFLINGKSYTLAPGEGWVLDNQPLGLFTLEVLGGPTGVIQPREDRLLKAGTPYELTVVTR